MTEKEKPKKPEYKTLETPDIAVASAIKQLTSKTAMELLANIEPRDIPRLALLLSIAHDFELTWLEDYVLHELALSASVEGKRADQIVQITRSPDFLTQETSGIIDRIKQRFRR
jgi:hypothetical protein